MQNIYLLLLLCILVLFLSTACDNELLKTDKTLIYNLFNSGKTALEEGKLSESFQYFIELESELEKVANIDTLEKLHLISLLYLGEIHIKLGNENEALNKLLACRVQAKIYGNEMYEINALNNISYISTNNVESKSIIENALKEFKITPENEISLDNLKYKLAIINAENGNTDEAENEINNLRSKQIYQGGGRYNNMRHSNFNKVLGKISFYKKRYEEALTSYNKAIKLNDTKILEAELHLLIAKAYLAQKNYDRASSSLNTARNLIKDDLLLKKQLNELYLELYENTDNTQQGLTILSTLRNIDNTLNSENNKIQGFIADKLEKENLKADKRLSKARINYISILSILSLLLFSLFHLYKQARSKENLLELEVSKKELEVENKQLEVENQTLEVKNKELELAAINKVIDAQEEEQKKLAEVLHDNIGANLSALNMYLSTLKKDVPERKYSHFSKVLTRTIKDTRNLSHLLEPPALKGVGLTNAIMEKAEEFSCEKLSIEVVDCEEHVSLEPKISRSLYNAILEFMNNTMRHSEATKMRIIFSMQGNHTLAVKITDNGRGFDTSNIQQSSKGLGLNSIKSRIKYFDGTFDIQSSSQGTTINITVPVREVLKQTA